MTTPDDASLPPAEQLGEEAPVVMETAPDTSWVSMVDIAKQGEPDEGND